MIGIVSADINNRRLPSQQSDVVGFYKEGAIVDVAEVVQGEEYDNEDTWYRLSNGTYLWSGGVSIERDASGLPLAERSQYMLCYRKKLGPHPLLQTFEPADTIYPAALTLPATIFDVDLDQYDYDGFIAALLTALKDVPANRKHVFIYIHGYQLISSLKLDLFSHFVQSYFARNDNKIAKAIFFAWPAQGGPARKSVDDRSITAGEDFTKKGLFNRFNELAVALRQEGYFLNLVVHSFGHQLLNGMLNPGEDGLLNFNPKVFENVFLMAPDVSHLAVQNNGADLENYFGTNPGDKYHYDYSKLTSLAEKVHVFYDRDDFLLYVSTRKFVGKDRAADIAEKTIVEAYRGLGNYGNSAIPDALRQPGFIFYNIQELIKNAPPADPYDFSFKSLKSKLSKIVDKVHEDGDYSKLSGLRVLFNSGRLTDHHRYLFTCKPIVDKIQSLL